jgi:NAD(P)-dependent dehydrogenase (short-subunit alcohol dehydrogenase family)
MTSTPNKVIVVVAAGPLIGTATAAHFASKGFTHVALLSRDVRKLTETAGFIVPFAKENGNANVVLKTYEGDVSKAENLLKALKQIEADFGPPEVVLYNAAVVKWARIGDVTEEELVEEFKVNVVSIIEINHTKLTLATGFNCRPLHHCEMGISTPHR